MEAFNQRCEEFYRRFSHQENELIENMNNDIHLYNSDALNSLKEKLTVILNNINIIENEFKDYLERVHTNESKVEVEKLDRKTMKVKEEAQQLMSRIDFKIEELQEVRSTHSISRHSTRSSRSSIMSVKQANAEAAKARAQFARQESELLKQQAELEERQRIMEASTLR